MVLNLGPVIDHYSWIIFMLLHCAKRKHTATRTVDKHTSTRELAFKTADFNGPNPESVIYSSFSQLISVRTRLQVDPPFSWSLRTPRLYDTDSP